MKNRIITISRQFGSAGRSIGKAVAENLGIPCYDQELIEMFSQESGFSEEYIKEHGEHAQKGGLLSGIFQDRVYDTPHTQDVLWDAQKKVILDLAKKGPCVIVGRCAGHILKDSADCLRVFIHADIEKRAERILHIYGETEESPLKRIRDKDKRRKTYYEQVTGGKWGAAEDHHITLDSGVLGFDTCVRILTELSGLEVKG